MTETKQPAPEVAGLIFTLEEVAQSVPYEKEDAFRDELFNGNDAMPNIRVREIVGPLINGLWVFTVEIETDRPIYDQINKVRYWIDAVFDRHATPRLTSEEAGRGQ